MHEFRLKLDPAVPRLQGVIELILPHVHVTKPRVRLRQFRIEFECALEMSLRFIQAVRVPAADRLQGISGAKPRVGQGVLRIESQGALEILAGLLQRFFPDPGKAFAGS